MTGKMVYSTNPKNDLNEGDPSAEDALSPQEQSLEAHFSNKGRGGKTVTIIKGFRGSDSKLEELAKLIKTKCSVGGSVKGGEIIIQGNIRDKVSSILESEGYKVKRVGG